MGSNEAKQHMHPDSAHLEQAMQADGKQRRKFGYEAVWVQDVRGRVQERRETRVHRQKRRHCQREGGAAGKVQVQDAAVEHEEAEGSWQHHAGRQKR